MKTDNATAKNVDARETRAERAIRLLQTMPVDPFETRLEEFKPFYPAVVSARRKGRKTKQILKLLADGGLKLYPGLLEKLVAAMEKIEGTPCCELCGQALQIDEPCPAPNRISEILAQHD